MADAPIPQYYRIKQSLLDAIERGAYPLGHAPITERAICQQFGVSRITAVRALQDLVNDGLLVRHRGRGTFVTEQARLHDKPTLVATPATAKLIGIIFQRLYGQHITATLHGVEHVLRAAGHHLLLSDSQGSARTEAENIQRAINAGVGGLIVLPVEGSANTKQFQALHDLRLPFVMIDRYYPALPSDSVVPDNFAIGYEITKRLIAAGHTRIAFVAVEANATSVQDRYAGYRLALREHQIPLTPELSFLDSYNDTSDDQRYRTLSTWLTAVYRPTAFLAVNSFVLTKVVTDLLQLGVQLSDDVGLASMDNANLDDLLARTAIVATIPSFEMGKTAGTLLLDRVANPDQSARHVILPAEISATSSITLELRTRVETAKIP